MLLIVWQNVRGAPVRFLASAASIALAIVTAMVSLGLYLGLAGGLVRYLATFDGDVVVTEPAGSALVLRTSSTLDPGAAERVRALRGVEGVGALHGRLAWIQHGERESLVFAVGLYRDQTFAGPVRVLTGDGRPRIDEIVVDQVLAADLGLSVGDRVTLGPASLRVAGIAAGGNVMLATYAFVHRGALMLSGVLEPSYLFVRAAPGVAPAALAASIATSLGLRAFTRDDFLARNQAMAQQLLLPVIVLLVAVSVVVSGGVVGMTLYTATLDRHEEYGLLKAIGLPGWRLYAAAAIEGMGAAGLGLVVGLAAGYTVASRFAAYQPRFEISLPPSLVAGIAAATIVIGLLASLLPARTIAGLDPALVLRV